MAGGGVGRTPGCQRRRIEWKLRNYGANIGEAWAAAAGCADGHAGLGLDACLAEIRKLVPVRIILLRLW